MVISPTNIKYLIGTPAKGYQEFEVLFFPIDSEPLIIFTRRSEVEMMRDHSLADEVIGWGGIEPEDPIEILVNIEFRVGSLTGCFPIAYIATKATPNLICSGVQSWAPISYPHPIQIETTEDCNSITAVAEEGWSELIHLYEGWTGADGIYSIPFNGNEQYS